MKRFCRYLSSSRRQPVLPLRGSAARSGRVTLPPANLADSVSGTRERSSSAAFQARPGILARRVISPYSLDGGDGFLGRFGAERGRRLCGGEILRGTLRGVRHRRSDARVPYVAQKSLWEGGGATRDAGSDACQISPLSFSFFSFARAARNAERREPKDSREYRRSAEIGSRGDPSDAPRRRRSIPIIVICQVCFSATMTAVPEVARTGGR